MAFREVGNFVARGANRVDPTLVSILQQAAATMPGYSVEAYSGFRPGDPRFHGKGMATDVRLIGPDGKAVPNYQSGQGYRVYEQLAQNARAIQMAQHPELADKFRWGGYFGGRKGAYGNADLMHFDLGGSPSLGMAGGSWAGGPSAKMVADYGLAGASPTAVAANAAPAGGVDVGAMLAQATAPADDSGLIQAMAPPPAFDMASLNGLGDSGGLSGGGAPPAASDSLGLDMQPDDQVLPPAEPAVLPAGPSADELGARYQQAKLQGGPVAGGLADLFKIKDVGQAKQLRRSRVA